MDEINRELLKADIMLTTSIAFGPFSYHQRIEFEGIEKNPIFGNAYVTAFLDNEKGKPRIQPGQCRVLVNELDDNFFGFDRRLRKSKNHFYYYWMVDNCDQIDDFERQYNDSYQMKYKGMLSALKNKSD